jgi:transcriptional regulator with XRE-family HTH domain
MPRPAVRGLLPFALRLRALRARRGVTQRDIADAAGVARGTVGFLEQARCCPTADSLARLAEVFGVTMHELWHGTGRCEGVGVLRETEVMR